MSIIRLLGPVDVVDSDGRVRTPGSPIRATLLALLALESGKVVDAERLLDRAWNGEPPGSGLRALRFHISKLRSELAIEGLIVTVGSGYRSGSDTDIDQVKAVCAEEELSAAAATELLDLWRGDALSGTAPCESLEHERTRLHELQLTIMERRFRADIKAGHAALVIADLSGLCSEYPLREGLWASLITAHYHVGNQAEALRTYDRLRLALLEILGVDPSPELRKLHDQVLQQHEGLARAPDGWTVSPEFDSIDSAQAAEGNLPTAFDMLVGRDRDVDTVCTLLSSHRLVTIVGVGGIGKTRLALESARRVADGFTDGAWLCELAEVSTADAVAAAVGQTIGCRQHPGRTMTESISEFCRNRQILVVLDNCEHVLGAVVELVDVVLGRGAAVSVLTTSREVLGSRREQAYPLGSLESTRADSPALELFVRRAGQVDPTLAWDEQQMAAVATICQRLDGMPLAIELAASRTRVMSPIEIHAHLDDAFRLLRGGRQSIDRHRTLQAAIDWSYALLADEERSTFHFLSVFSGSCDLEAAVFVGKCMGLDEFEVIDNVDALVAKSMVIAESGRDGLTWYRLLEPLRQYAEDALSAAQQTDVCRRAHLEFYRDWAASWRNQLPGSGLAWKTGLLDRFANLRAAVSWGLTTGDAQRTSELISSLGLAQQALLLFEIGDWAEQVLELPGIEFLPNGAALAGNAAMAHWWRGDVPEFIRLVESSIDMPGRDPCEITTVSVESLLAVVSGDRQSGVDLMDRADRSDPVADVVASYMKLALAQETLDDEIELLKRVFDETQSRWVDAILCLFSAKDNLILGRYEQAAASARRGCRAAADIGATFYVHHCVFALSDSLGATGQISDSDALTIATTLREQRDAGQELDQWLVITGLDLLLYRLGHRELAATIRRSYRSTVWATTNNFDLSAVPEQGELEQAATGAAETGISELVDAVLAVVDDIAGNKHQLRA